jgi:hypothetical protein
MTQKVMIMTDEADLDPRSDAKRLSSALDCGDVPPETISAPLYRLKMIPAKAKSAKQTSKR